MSIWTDEVINTFAGDAPQEVNTSVHCLYHKFYLTVTAGTSVYTLPEKVKGVLRITWFGRKVDPLSWEDLTLMNPSTVFVNGSTKVETASSRPQWYALHPTNHHDIRFYPTPDVSLIATGDPYSPTHNEQRCCISCWRNVDLSDPLASLPNYIDRRTRKAYVLWKAFEKEGKGQDSQAAKYYKGKFDFLVKLFTLINSGVFVSKKYTLGDGTLDLGTFRYPRPMLPSNFERILY